MMQIETVNPEIISQQDFIPTEIELLFINPRTNSVVIVSDQTALKVTIP